MNLQLPAHMEQHIFSSYSLFIGNSTHLWKGSRWELIRLDLGFTCQATCKTLPKMTTSGCVQVSEWSSWSSQAFFSAFTFMFSKMMLRVIRELYFTFVWFSCQNLPCVQVKSFFFISRAVFRPALELWTSLDVTRSCCMSHLPFCAVKHQKVNKQMLLLNCTCLLQEPAFLIMWPMLLTLSPKCELTNTTIYVM